MLAGGSFRAVLLKHVRTRSGGGVVVLRVCVYIYIYIYAGELFLVPLPGRGVRVIFCTTVF